MSKDNILSFNTKWQAIRDNVVFAEKLATGVPDYGLFLVVGRGAKGKSVSVRNFFRDSVAQGWVRDFSSKDLDSLIASMDGREFAALTKAANEHFIRVPYSGQGRTEELIVKILCGGEPDVIYSFDYAMASLFRLDLSKVDVVVIDSLRELALRQNDMSALARFCSKGSSFTPNDILTGKVDLSVADALVKDVELDPQFAAAGFGYCPGLRPTSQIFTGGNTAQFITVLSALNRFAMVNSVRIFANFNPQLADSKELRSALDESCVGTISLDTVSNTSYRTIEAGNGHRVGHDNTLVQFADDATSESVMQQSSFYSLDSDQLEEER